MYAIRSYYATEVRVFKGRDSTGVRGIKLADGDEVVSMSIIRHFEATPGEREAYLKMRRAVNGVSVITSYSIHYTKLYECFLAAAISGGKAENRAVRAPTNPQTRRSTISPAIR